MKYMNLTNNQVSQILDICENNGLEPDFISLEELKNIMQKILRKQ